MSTITLSPNGGLTITSINNTISTRLIRSGDITYPALCNRRRGGPRSKIFCSVYKEVPHDIHFGKSPRTYKWYKWEEDSVSEYETGA